MKVAVIIDTWFPFVGGGQINAWEISKRIAQNGIEIDIITRNCGKTKFLKSKNLKVIQLGKKGKNNQISQIIFCINTLIFINKKNYDLIHAHAFLPGLILPIIKFLKKKPTVFTVHGTSIGTNLHGFLAKIIELVVLTKIHYDYQITVSRDFLRLPNVNHNLKYIPNGVFGNNLQATINHKPKKIQILFVGRLHLQKNIISLVRAFKELVNINPNIQLVIAGDGAQKNEIINEINRLHLEKVISLLGEIKGDKLVKLYKSSSIFVLPSIYEGQSLALLDAFKYRLAPVATPVGDNSYLIQDKINGFLIKKPFSTSQIKDALNTALKSKNINQIIQKNYLLSKNFSWQNSANLTINMYKKLLHE